MRILSFGNEITEYSKFSWKSANAQWPHESDLKIIASTSWSNEMKNVFFAACVWSKMFNREKADCRHSFDLHDIIAQSTLFKEFRIIGVERSNIHQGIELSHWIAWRINGERSNQIEMCRCSAAQLQAGWKQTEILLIVASDHDRRFVCFHLMGGKVNRTQCAKRQQEPIATLTDLHSFLFIFAFLLYDPLVPMTWNMIENTNRECVMRWPRIQVLPRTQIYKTHCVNISDSFLMCENATHDCIASFDILSSFEHFHMITNQTRWEWTPLGWAFCLF